MRRLMNIVMFSCKRATELIEKRQIIGHLPLIHRVKLAMHTSMCDACKSYVKQSVAIDKSIEQHINNESPEELILSDESKTKIINTLENNLENN